MAWALGLFAFVKFQQGDRDEAEHLAPQVLAEARERGDRWATAMMLVLSAGCGCGRAGPTRRWSRPARPTPLRPAR